MSLSYINRITKGREQILNKTFIAMMEQLGYDVRLVYEKREDDQHGLPEKTGC